MTGELAGHPALEGLAPAQILSHLDKCLDEVVAIVRGNRPEEKGDQLEDLLVRGERFALELDRRTSAVRHSLKTCATSPDKGIPTISQLGSLLAAREGARGTIHLGVGALHAARGRKFSARRHLEVASDRCKPAVAATALKLLAKMHAEDERGELQARAYAAISLSLPTGVPKVDKAQSELIEVIEELEATEKRSAGIGEAEDSSDDVPTFVATDAQVATYGVASIYERKNLRGIAADMYFTLLSRRAGTLTVYGESAYARLRHHARILKSSPGLAALGHKLLTHALDVEIQHALIIPEIFLNDSLDDEARLKLVEEVSAKETQVVARAKGIRDLDERRLTLYQGHRLSALARLGCSKSLQEADDDATAERADWQSAMPYEVFARLLHDLWSRRVEGILSGEIEVDRNFQLKEVLHGSDRRLYWICEAVAAGRIENPSTALDVGDLVDLLFEIHHAATNDAPRVEQLSGPLQGVEMQEVMLQVLAVLCSQLASLDRGWRDLDRMERLDLVIQAVSEAKELSDFARGDLRLNAHGWVAATGALEPRVQSYIELTKLLIEQRRYDRATQAANEAVALDPDFAEAQYWLGLAYIRAGKRLLAMENLNIAAEKLGHAAAHGAIAEDCLREEEFASAADSFLKAAASVLKRKEPAASWEIDLAKSWLAQATRANDQVQAFRLFKTGKLTFRQRREHKREITDRNDRIAVEKRRRAKEIAELTQLGGWYT